MFNIDNSSIVSEAKNAQFIFFRKNTNDKNKKLGSLDYTWSDKALKGVALRIGDFIVGGSLEITHTVPLRFVNIKEN